MAEIEAKLPYKLPTFHDWQPHASFYHPLYAGSIDGTDQYPHDRAVVRAMLSTYKPNKNVDGDQSKTLFVARLSKDTSQDTIRGIYEKFGELEKCRLIRDFVTGFSRGYAFVEFKRKKDALNAAKETHKLYLDGKQILVEFECERNLKGWKPRRFGGGFGGRKESGQLRFGGIDRPFRRPLPENVNPLNRGAQRESSVSFQDSRGDKGKGSRDRERYDACKRDHGGSDRDHRSHGRDRDYRDRRDSKSYDRDYKSERRDREDNKGNSGDYRHKDDRDKRGYRDKQKDYRKHDRRDRDEPYRGKDEHYRDRDNRYRERRHRDRDLDKEEREEIRNESSHSSRDPE